MKTIISILIICAFVFGQYGSIDQSRYTNLLDKISKEYKPYAKVYNDTAISTQYVFDFPEVSMFPYDCAGGKIDKDKAGNTVYAYPYGGVLKSRVDTVGIEHIQIPIIQYYNIKSVASIEYFEMRFYMTKTDGTWVEEKKPVKVILYKNKGNNFYDCR